MKTLVPVRLLATGILLMLMVSFVAACGGDNQEFATLAPTSTPTKVIPPTDAPAPTDAPPTSAPVTQAPEIAVAPPDGESIQLSLIIMKRDANDVVSELQAGEVLTSKDFYGIFFEPEVDSWVYILQQDSTKAIDVLFPNPAFSDLTNPLTAGTKVWIPKDVNNWFHLDETVGKEAFFVVASKARDEKVESMIAGHEREELLGPLAVFLQAGARGLGGAEKLDKEPKILPDGSTVALEEQLLKGDGDNFVYSLEFLHE